MGFLNKLLPTFDGSVLLEVHVALDNHEHVVYPDTCARQSVKKTLLQVLIMSSGVAALQWYCPARWIWLKVVSFGSSLLKGEAQRFFRQIGLSPIL
jgi:hypothetical protein